MDTDLVLSLWRLIEPVLEPEGVELVDLEFRPEGGRRVLRLYIDRPGGITLDDCALISRQVSALLDLEDPIDQSYHLEVSSPGINRALKREKDFCAFAGSPVRIKTRRKLQGRRNFQGILKGMEESMVVIEVDGTRIRIPTEDMQQARLDLPDSEFFRDDLRRRAGTTGD